MKKLMAQEEAMVPAVFYNLKRALVPLLHDDTYEAMAKVVKMVEDNSYQAQQQARALGGAGAAAARAPSFKAVTKQGDEDDDYVANLSTDATASIPTATTHASAASNDSAAMDVDPPATTSSSTAENTKQQQQQLAKVTPFYPTTPPNGPLLQVT